MGNKAGYSAVILAALGLRSGGGAAAYWWAEADADVAALLRAYPDAALLQRIAEIIRGWAGEEPRALWERLRAERKARGPREDAEGTAGWTVVQAWSHSGKGEDHGFAAAHAAGIDRSIVRDVPEETARAFAAAVKAARNARGLTRAAVERELGTGGALAWWEGEGSNSAGGGQLSLPRWPMYLRLKALVGLADDWDDVVRPTPKDWHVKRVGQDDIADACTRLAEYAMIAASNRLINVAGPDLTNTGAGGTTFGGEAFATPAREVAERFEGMAREVAGYTISEAWGATGQWCGPDRGGACGAHPEGWVGSVTLGGLVRRYESASSSWPTVRVTRSIPTAAEVAAALGTPGDLSDVVVYMDPPYQGTTGYAHDLGRDEVVRIAYDFDRLGAIVAISEADIVIPDWHAVEITGGRRGQKRTFSRQQAEWLTVNREPAHRVAVQTGLFGGA